MRRGGKTLICLLCIIALTPKVRAVVNDAPASAPATSEDNAKATDNSDSTENPDSPYSAIWLRNVFDLKPAPPPPPPTTATNTPPPNVELTGITTLLGTKRALFMVQESGGPGKPAGKPESYILTEGQRQGELEVLEISPKAKTVRIKVSDLVSTITFKTNQVAIGPQGGAPGVGTLPVGGIPRSPGFNPPGFNPAGGVPMPARVMRPGGGGNGAYTPQGANYNQGGYNGGYAGGGFGGVAGGGVASANTPGLAIPGFGSSAPTQTMVPAPEAAAPEVTGAILNLQKQAADNAGVPFPPLPPPFVVPGSSGSSAGTGNETGVGGSISPPAPPPLPGSFSTGTLKH
jgi:hypothetical protein